MNIVLIGYRAAGKSTIGKHLASKLGLTFYDVDRHIESRIAPETLTAFYTRVGENGFRPIETEIVLELCDKSEAVIAFGAGSLIRKPNQQSIKLNTLVVYVKVPARKLWARIQSDPSSGHTRPDLAGGGLKEVKYMLEKREPVYNECSDIVVNGNQSTTSIVDEIILIYNSNQRN